MICYRLVVGIRDASLSERLQLDQKLTLKTANKSIHQREAVHEQQSLLPAEQTPPAPAQSMRSALARTEGEYTTKARAPGQTPLAERG